MFQLLIIVSLAATIQIADGNLCPTIINYNQYVKWENLTQKIPTAYASLGCFRDESNRALIMAEGTLNLLDPNYKVRSDAINKCFAAAIERKHPIFAVQDGGQCFTGESNSTYNKYGPVNNCVNGKGGSWANDVYKILFNTTCQFCPYGTAWNYTVNSFSVSSRYSLNDNLQLRSIIWSADLRIFVAVGNRIVFSTDGIIWYSAQDYKSLGCFKDEGNRALIMAEGTLNLLEIDYKTRSDAIDKCYAAAIERKHPIFAVQDGGQCFTGADDKTYYQYGSATNCQNGKGGPWANDVYLILRNTTGDWNSIVWSPELRIFVAVGSNGTNRLVTSINGKSWTARNGTTENKWNSVTWSPELGLFVAVASSGGSNRVMTSNNGIDWNLRNGVVENNWSCVTWSPELGLFVAVASSGRNDRVMTSRNGIDWIVGVAEDYNWNSVTWASDLGLFVAVATEGKIMSSNDGYDWSVRIIPNANNDLRSVIWSPELGQLIAVASNGTNRMITSRDGINWLASNATDYYSYSSIAWSSELGLFAAIPTSGSGNDILTSITRPDSCRISCNTNSIWNSTLSRCTKCPFGFVPNRNQTQCFPCPVGTETSFNRSSCMTCPAGKYRASLDSMLCSRCPVGTEPSLNRTMCLQCSSGKFRASFDSPQCNECPWGTESSLNRTACVQCPIGKFRPPFALTYCMDCPVGATCTSMNMTCVAGFYPSLNVSYACNRCEDGFYKEGDGNFPCQRCSTGLFSSDDYTKCLACSAGYYLRPSDNSCQRCGPGKQPSPDRTTCNDCSSGFYKPSDDYNSCLKCPTGAVCSNLEFICNAGGEKSGDGCRPCRAGYYKSTSGNNITCSSCPTGYESNSDKSGCNKCTNGKYRSANSEYPYCIDCPLNSAYCHHDGFECSSGYKLTSDKQNCDKMSNQDTVESQFMTAETLSINEGRQYGAESSALNWYANPVLYSIVVACIVGVSATMLAALKIWRVIDAQRTAFKKSVTNFDVTTQGLSSLNSDTSEYQGLDYAQDVTSD